MIRIYIFILCGLAAMMGCRKAKNSVVQAPASVVADSVQVVTSVDTVVYYERTACFGMCPIFKCVILSNNTAFYEGRNFVDRIGSFQTNLDPTALQKIYAKCNQIGYFGLKEQYDHAHVTDLPSVITRIQQGNNDLQVVNRYRGPRELNDLYALLDATIAACKWEQVAEEKK